MTFHPHSTIPSQSDLEIRPSRERGHFDHGWLKSAHSFSFADYQDPRHVHFESLRVINIAANSGFPTHPHQNMEIITYVLKGAIAHKDSMGNVKTVQAGEVQTMSAGTGVQHSEFNPSQSEATHMFQIWIYPSQLATAPAYGQKSFAEALAAQTVSVKVASPEGDQGSLRIGQKADIFVCKVAKGHQLDLPTRFGGSVYVHLMSGQCEVLSAPLEAGDGAKIRGAETLKLSAGQDSFVLVFDLAPFELRSAGR